MSPRARRAVLRGAGLVVVTWVTLLATASPAAAHDVNGGALPAPTWLLGYLGAFAVLATALVLRVSWTRPTLTIETGSPTKGPRITVGSFATLALLALTLVAALFGANEGARNVAPVAVLVVWWVGLPLAALVLGDVLRWANPFVPLVAAAERLLPRRARSPAPPPAWTAAAMLWGFRWLYLAYYRPGSPRAVAVLLITYTGAAVAGGWWWGRAWLTTGEGFGALSRAAGGLTRGRIALPATVLGPLAVAWLAGTAFDAVSATGFWGDVLGTSRGWSRTLLGTVGYVWITGIVAAAALVISRVLAQARSGPDARPVSPDNPPGDQPGASMRSAAAGATSVGVPVLLALLPLAAGWAVSHDLTLLLFEGRNNFVFLVSDPLGRGWDLFGTFDWSVDVDIVQAGWVRAVQLGALVAGHVGAVLVAHDAALARLGRRAGMRATWSVAALSAGSAVAAAFLVLG